MPQLVRNFMKQTRSLQISKALNTTKKQTKLVDENREGFMKEHIKSNLRAFFRNNLTHGLRCHSRQF